MVWDVMINISPETLSGITGILSAALGAWNARQGRQIRALQEQVSTLTSWRTMATQYIGTLLWAMASHGIPAPAPPPLLGLVPPEPETGDPSPAPASPGPLPPDQVATPETAPGTSPP